MSRLRAPGPRAADDGHGVARRRRVQDARVAPDERGAATVLGLVLLGVVTATAVLVSAVGGVVVGQRRVQAAADLAALAAAVAVQQGHDGCAAARRLAARNGARLHACRLDGPVSRVEVAVDLTALPVRSLTLTAAARAGPVDGDAGAPVAVR